MYRYRFIKAQHPTQQDPCMDAYDIVAEKHCHDAWISVAHVPNVSTSQSLVSHLTKKCTRGQLDPIHLLDVILDAIP